MANKPYFEQIDLFVSGTDGYHTYRIPSIIVTSGGTILAFCEGRKRDRHDEGNIDVLMKRSVDNGKTWQLGGATPSDKVNECEVAELEDLKENERI